VDIGARARQLQARRLWTIALSGTAVAGFVIVVLNTFQQNLMFYITPSQVWGPISRQVMSLGIDFLLNDRVIAILLMWG
jgi:cytochrome c-type biogenesis protein CcmE